VLVRHFIREATWRAYEEAIAFEVVPHDDVEVIHKFRSTCRRLRFTLELFGDALQRPSNLVEQLKALQGRLGELHDHVVATARIERWMARAKLPRTRAIREYSAERRRAGERLHAEFESEWRAVSGHAFRAAVFRALDGESAAHAPTTLRLVPRAPTRPTRAG
jgi:CHAD domain-containing protein